MTTLRKTAAAATDLAIRVAGRSQVVRASRFVLLRARRDFHNDRNSNGETSLQRWTLDLSPDGRGIHVVDVGANVGQWARTMLATARHVGRLDDLDLHSFEPSSYTFARLSEALDGQGVILNQAALSDRSGTSTLHVIGPGAATNSLHRPNDAPDDSTTEQVATMTLDSYADSAQLDHIMLLKIDAEGNDLAVLRGAQKLFTMQRISVAQFEYNHRWIYGRYFLRDAFDLLDPLGYQLGKLTPYGVEFYPRWDADLETFVEGNYVVCAPEIAGQLPSVSWWKSGS